MKSKILLCLFLVISLFGCNINEQSSSKIQNTTDAVNNNEIASLHNKTISIFNLDNQVIGEICCFTFSNLFDNNILYTKLPQDSPSSTIDLEYWIYNIPNQTDTYVGTVKDWMYEASYESIYVDDHLYISVSTGDYIERTQRKQIIYDINLTDYTMLPILEVNGGVPYNSFTIIDNMLYLAELLENGDTDLIKLNLSDIYKNAPIVHEYDESKIFVNDSIRHISSDDNYVYLLRLDWNENKDYFLYVDTYDKDFNLLKTIEMSDACIPVEYSLTEDDIENELKQWVAYFEVNEQYIFYKNFSATSFLGQIMDNKSKPLIKTNSLFDMVKETTFCPDTDYFIQTYGEESNNRNVFFRTDLKSGEISSAVFYADDERYTFTSASRNDTNMVLLQMSSVRLNTNDEVLPERLYYFNLDDLEFN